MRRRIVFAVIAFCLLGCSCQDRTSNATVAKGQYIILVTGDHNTHLVGDNVDTNWGPASGFIYLGTDENNEPLGTLTMTMGGIVPGGEDINEYAILTALLSKTDVRVGTAHELNARLFELTEGTITNVEIGANFVKGSFGLEMSRVLSNPDHELEDIEVVGTFTAMS